VRTISSATDWSAVTMASRSLLEMLSCNRDPRGEAEEGGRGIARYARLCRTTQKRNFRASCRIRGELTVLEITPNEEELDTAEPGFEKFG